MKIYCRHYDCQCHAAHELSIMSDRTGRTDLLFKAVEIFKCNLEVRCRHVPRRGPIEAPFP